MSLTIPMIDGNNAESSYTVKLNREQYANAIRVGADKLDAAQVGKHWYYRAEETNEVYRLTDREVAEYGAGTLDPRGVNYSLWCSYTGRQMKRPARLVREALSIQ